MLGPVARRMRGYRRRRMLVAAREHVARALAGAGALTFTCVSFTAPASAEEALRGFSGAGGETPQTCAEACFILLGVSVEGANAISQSDLAAVYEPYLARWVSVDDLAPIAEAITARYRAAGYFLSRAVVPTQDGADGIAHIAVFEGRISEIVIEGEGRAQARPYLRGLDTSPIASLHDLDHRLALANDVPGLSVRSRIEPVVDDPRKHRLVVSTEFTALNAYASLDNRGAQSAGPTQAYGRVLGNSVFVDRDDASLGIFTTPAAPGDFTYVEAAYGFTFEDGARAAIAASASRAHDGHDAASPEIGGNGAGFSLRYERPLQRARSGGLWLGAGFDFRHAANDWVGGGGYVDELRVARFGLRGFLSDDGVASTLFARVSFGLDVLGASGRSLTNRSRYDAHGEFVTISLHASHYRDLGRYLGLYLSLDGQWADRPLLLSEEFSVGGQPYGRGYGPGEISGDYGAAGLAELRAGYDPELGVISFVQAYLFYDAAEVWNYDTPSGADELSLSSAGVGLRVSLDDWLTASLELARPLTRTPSEEGDKDWRQFFTVTASY